MDQNFRPLLIVPAVPRGAEIRFFHWREEIDVSPVLEHVSLWRILKFCNGQNDLQKVAMLSGVATETVQKIISKLKQLELVVDSRGDEILGITSEIATLEALPSFLKSGAVANPVVQVYARTFGEDSAFFGATAVYYDGNGCLNYAGATSPVYEEALFKATIEGYERWLSSQVRVDFYGPAHALSNYVDPYVFFPLTKKQAKKCGLDYFTKDLELSWTLGKTYSGEEIYVPSDIVYYGQKQMKNQIYYGHSSGIAAFFNFGEAKKRALAELIERDALMRSWYGQVSPKILGGSALPVYAQKRIAHWKERGRKMYILNPPSRFGCVIEAIIVGPDYPSFVSGAAATLSQNEVNTAINKAIQEAEYNLLLCLNSPVKKPIDLHRVFTPADHGRTYYDKKAAKRLAFLWHGETIEAIRPFAEYGLPVLEQKLETITVELSEPHDELRVVRMFSPKLVQINFGFYSAHYTYPFLKVKPEILKWPHYFA